MTENLPPLLTVVPDKPEKAKPQEDEGIIKCICNFAHDDGATVFCEKCNTWQHIDCYYHPLGEAEKVKQEDFDHSCADCNPRILDKHQAMERQRKRLGLQPDEDSPHDKRPKKAPAKAPKKKIKPSDLQLNGHAGADASKHGSPQDHPPAKKHKISHKSSQSVSSHAPKRSPSHSAQRATPSHPISPATTPPDSNKITIDFELPNYTEQFLHLYDESDLQIVDTNTYGNLDLQTRISEWLKEGHDSFRKDTACDFKDVVIQPDRPPLEHPLKVESETLKGTVVHRKYLTTASAIDKDVPMMELNGIVGLQKQYTEQNGSQWSDLCAPLPFVFFPPSVPLFIDTRKEGSNARYVRRSCKPNASIDTYYLSDGAVFHFWLVSDRPIAAKEQITLPWEFRFAPDTQRRFVKLLGLGDEETNGHVAANIDPADYNFLSDWISRILSLYGGCACDLGNDCAFIRFHRNYRDKVQPRPNPQKRKRAKTKTHTISPTSTGQATNSRAASEGHLDEMAETDVNVAAGSRSKPPSRDRTPARLGSFDHIGILTEPTNRDKRKVQMAEDLFQKTAQEQQQPPRKKKKASTDATANPTTNSGTVKPKARTGINEIPDKSTGGEQPRYVDAGTSGSKPVSPTSATSHHSVRSVKPPASSTSGSRKGSSEAPKCYSDAAVQTEPEPDHCVKPRPKRRVMSLTMRLMAQKRRDVLPQRPSSAMDLDSPTTTKSSLGSPSTAHKQCPLSSPTSAGDVDAPMPDAPPAPGNVVTSSPPLTNGTVPVINPKEAKSPELRVSMPPPAFTSPTSATSVTAVTTPISTNGSVAQSPFSNANLPSPFAPPVTNGNTAAPSPIKKKMSLSEYKNKANKAAASAKSITDTTHPLKTASSTTDPLKATSNGDNRSMDLDRATADSGAGEATGSISAAQASTVP